jgi:Domain of unknown function (DUF4126)
MSDFALPIILGIALAAATGFRVFLPMLIVSAAAYTGHLSLDNSFAWLGTPAALIMLSVAAVAEILAYYIPVVDNLLDSHATPAIWPDMQFSQFFEFAIVVVVVGALIVLATGIWSSKRRAR